MPAVDTSEFARFGIVGMIATGLYATLAMALTAWDRVALTPVAASLTAYAAAAIFSYLAHKSITFLSTGSHRLEVPRFLALTTLGVAIAWAAPVILTGLLALKPIFAILFTCVVVPLLNYVVMDKWVFARRKLHG